MISWRWAFRLVLSCKIKGPRKYVGDALVWYSRTNFHYRVKEILVRSGGSGVVCSEPVCVPPKGIYVTRISSGGPADVAGLRMGDKIMQVSGDTCRCWSSDRATRGRWVNAAHSQLSVDSRWSWCMFLEKNKFKSVNKTTCEPEHVLSSVSCCSATQCCFVFM